MQNPCGLQQQLGSLLAHVATLDSTPSACPALRSFRKAGEWCIVVRFFACAFLCRGVVDLVSDPASCLAVCAAPLSFLFCFGLRPRMFPIIVCFHAHVAQAAPGTFYASAPIIDVRLVCLLCVTVFLSSVQITLCAGASQTSLASSCWRACGVGALP